jgi:hypothetical protein
MWTPADVRASSRRWPITDADPLPTFCSADRMVRLRLPDLPVSAHTGLA